MMQQRGDVTFEQLATVIPPSAMKLIDAVMNPVEQRHTSVTPRTVCVHCPSVLFHMEQHLSDTCPPPAAAVHVQTQIRMSGLQITPAGPCR